MRSPGDLGAKKRHKRAILLIIVWALPAVRGAWTGVFAFQIIWWEALKQQETSAPYSTYGNCGFEWSAP